MEACSSAHYWARKLREQGHEVKLMAPQFVKPYVKANKTDAADAEAICKAGYFWPLPKSTPTIVKGPTYRRESKSVLVV